MKTPARVKLLRRSLLHEAVVLLLCPSAAFATHLGLVIELLQIGRPHTEWVECVRYLQSDVQRPEPLASSTDGEILRSQKHRRIHSVTLACVSKRALSNYAAGSWTRHRRGGKR